ncbi:uncharacterized protein EHS24_007292 [Apiotrichum porosum]|uniref:Uncharacterized protein n=1 Tax=Apiotrichum porosum TaxID=105984 RepID=A0A427XUA5_9TREE|nr:uncharacterized protein EHS24_007292 [Apiotrichum porosum]RSH82325.1 hypothetical protein EHS24_007292 [Apiotrichum porosum]
MAVVLSHPYSFPRTSWSGYYHGPPYRPDDYCLMLLFAAQVASRTLVKSRAKSRPIPPLVLQLAVIDLVLQMRDHLRPYRTEGMVFLPALEWKAATDALISRAAEIARFDVAFAYQLARAALDWGHNYGDTVDRLPRKSRQQFDQTLIIEFLAPYRRAQESLDEVKLSYGVQEIAPTKPAPGLRYPPNVDNRPSLEATCQLASCHGALLISTVQFCHQ